PKLRLGLLDTSRRDQQVLVLRKRSVNQIGYHWIRKYLRPVLVCQRPGAPSFRAATIALGRLHRRALVVRPDHAARREQQQQSQPFHGAAPAPGGSAQPGQRARGGLPTPPPSRTAPGRRKMARPWPRGIPVTTPVRGSVPG